MERENSLRDKILTHFIFFGFGISGAAALIYEVVWTRSLSTIMGSSTYALSTMLAAFMAGLSIGGWLGAALSPRIKRLNVAFALCELGIGMAGLVTIPVIKALTPLYIKTFYAFHLSFNTFSLVQFVIIFMIMAVPTTLMGLTFPLVIKLFAVKGKDVGKQAGHLYGINTLGAIIGSTIAGFLLIPAVGVKGAAMIAASFNIFTATVILLLSRDVKKLFIATALFLIVVPVSSIIDKPVFPFFSYYNSYRFGSYDMANTVRAYIEKNDSDSKILFHKEGVNSDVSLIQYRIHGFGSELALVNNGKQEAGDDRGFALLAYLPYFMHPGERLQTALNIGLGSGHTLRYLSHFPLEHIDSVELSEGILEVNRRFLVPQLFTDSRIEHIQADGRNYLLLTPRTYDMIIASPSWAVELASAGLLTDEFFGLVKKRLAQSGTFAVWVDFFMMPHKDLEIVTRTFSKHFRHAMGWYVEGDFVILVGSNTPFRHSAEEIMQSIISYRPDLKGTFNIAMSEDMIKRIPSGRINTDDRPVIEFNNAKNMITWRSGDIN